MDNAIISGATGAIGMALIKKLNMEGIHIFVVCRPESKRTNRIVENELITKVYCDISDIRELPSLIKKKCKYFFHLAWIGTDTPENRVSVEIQVKNICYTIDAVNSAYALGCEVFLGAGSQAEFGDVRGIIKPDMHPNPVSAYGVAKLCTNRMTLLLCNQLGMRHIWPRILSIYGPYMRDNTLLSTVIEMTKKGKKPSLTKCDQMWDYLYSFDAAEALYLLALYGKENREYILGNGRVNSLQYYAKTIRDIINPECELGFGEIPYRPDQVMHLEADINTITEDTGWKPKYSFEEGIAEMLKMYL